MTKIDTLPIASSSYNSTNKLKALYFLSNLQWRWGGYHINLGIYMDPIKYTKNTVTPFVRPNNPGGIPTTRDLMGLEEIQVHHLVFQSARLKFEKNVLE